MHIASLGEIREWRPQVLAAYEVVGAVDADRLCLIIVDQEVERRAIDLRVGPDIQERAAGL